MPNTTTIEQVKTSQMGEENPKPGQLVVLSGPAGVGKDTVLNRWCERNPKIKRVVTYTTRDPRPNETNGVEYHFVTKEKFLELAADNFFLEYNEYNGNFYGTPLHDINNLLAEGYHAVLKIEVKGAADARALRPDALLIFLLPPSLEVLEQRIRNRGTETKEVQDQRLAIAISEIERAKDYDVQVVNDDLEVCVSELDKILS
jgi:guanylate kinase